MSNSVQLTSVSRDDIRAVFIDWLAEATAGNGPNPLALRLMSNDEIVEAQTEYVWSRICNLSPIIMSLEATDHAVGEGGPGSVPGSIRALDSNAELIAESELKAAVKALSFDTRLNMYDHRIAEMIFKKVVEMRSTITQADSSADDLFAGTNN